ncbi:MAG: hypothetical protein ABSG38_16095 [Spirochaetia bacterium]|jgi:hypothetical protein
MAAKLQPFAWLGRGTLDITVSGRVHLKMPGMIVDDVQELQVLGPDRVAEIVRNGSGTFDLTLGSRLLDPALEESRLEAEGIEQKNIDFNAEQLRRTRKNIEGRAPVPVHDGPVGKKE